MAVASLVLGIVWIFGLGSLLAVILGFSARSEIKRSSGAKTGEGVALAGIILGFIGMCGVGVFFVLVVAFGAAVHHLAADLQPETVSYGTTVNVSDGGLNPGIQSVTVYSLNSPVTAQGQTTPAGDVLAVAQMQVCADSSGSQDGFDTDFMNVYFADSQTGSVDFSATVQGVGTNLTNLNSLGPNQCVSGYLPFDVAEGTHPIGVQYVSYIFRTVNWTT